MISGTADLTDEQLAFELQAMDWIGTDPQMALIELDRELVRVGGLAASGVRRQLQGQLAHQ